MTVGLVIVSHSARLAEGLRELALQVCRTPVRITTAAGLQADPPALGTDALAIEAAIQAVWSPDGVLVLMDLGSAVLNAGLALELLPEEQHHRVRLCAAPLVEGAVAAVVEAAAGAPLERVAAAAGRALASKASLLTEEPAGAGEAEAGTEASRAVEAATGAGQTLRLRIRDPHGLHLRPAGRLVTLVNRFAAEIRIRNLSTGSRRVNARSIHQLLLLGVKQGDEVEIQVRGDDAPEALDALQQLLGEEALAPHSLTGIPASAGTGVAPAVLLRPDDGRIEAGGGSPSEERRKLERALQQAAGQLEEVAAGGAGAAAAVAAGHLLFLKDPEILAAATERIEADRLGAAAAWRRTIDAVLRAYEEIGDAYLKSRAADVRDVGRRVLQALGGAPAPAPALAGPSILLARELLLSDLTSMEVSQVVGIGTAAGTATSHAALMARELGLPMVVGLGDTVLAIPPGTELGIDGAAGRLWIRPEAGRRRSLEAPVAAPTPVIPTTGSAATTPTEDAITRDGHAVRVDANIVDEATARRAMAQGAQGVGLLRTEVLFLPHTTAPDEEEQVRILERIAARLDGRPLTVRSLDVGGDKNLPFLATTAEANPFLGRRGIRLSLARPDLFGTQLRAILRLSAGHPVRLMLPMVSTTAEIRRSRELLEEARCDLQRRNLRFDAELPVGVMIEVPAAALMADRLAAEADFFSIGTNDLSQYVMAADRNNTAVAGLADPFEPAVLRLIRTTAAAARAAGIPVGVCGRMASDPLAVPLLLGLGIEELSVAVSAIAGVRRAIAGVVMTEAAGIAEGLLAMEDAESVRKALARWVAGTAP